MNTNDNTVEVFIYKTEYVTKPDNGWYGFVNVITDNPERSVVNRSLCKSTTLRVRMNHKFLKSVAYSYHLFGLIKVKFVKYTETPADEVTYYRNVMTDGGELLTDIPILEVLDYKYNHVEYVCHEKT